MRTDITDSYEDWERLAEDYFDLIPPDTDSFDLSLCIKWDYDDWRKTFKFYFDNEWDLDSFLDKVEDCPKKDETFGIGDLYEGVDRENLTITVEGKEGGLL